MLRWAQQSVGRHIMCDIVRDRKVSFSPAPRKAVLVCLAATPYGGSDESGERMGGVRLRAWSMLPASLLAALLVAPALPLPPAGAATEKPKTEKVPTGKARAQVGLIGAYPNPTFALEFGLGVAVSDIDGPVGRASSSYVDYGLATLLGVAIADLPTFKKLGITSAALPLLRLPEPASADSRVVRDVDRVPVLPHFVELEGQKDPLEEKAAPEVRSFVKGLPTAYDRNIDTGREIAHAAESSGKARTNFNVMEIGPYFSFGPGFTETSVDKKLSESHSSIEELKLGPIGTFNNSEPFISIKGMEWRAGQAMGKNPEGSFTFKSARIMGKDYAITDLPSMQAGVDAMNKSLGGWGIKVELPKVNVSEAGVTVSPMAFQFRDASLLAKAVGGIYQSLYSASVNKFFDMASQAIPESGLLWLLANVVIGMATGYGGLRFEAGGASADLGVKEVEVAPPVVATKDPSDGGGDTLAASSTRKVAWAFFLVLALGLAVVGLVDQRRLRSALGRTT